MATKAPSPATNFPRALETTLRAVAKQFPIVFLTGPRQSGKTTLARHAFPRFQYLSLEDLDERELAESDPRAFLGRLRRARGVILDEVQRAPGLFSYLQGVVDAGGMGPFVLTGSQQFQISARIGQTLAGRAAILTLHPLAVSELLRRPALDPTRLHLDDRRRIAVALPDRDDILYRGLYPRIHAAPVDARAWLNGYVRTYVERDVRDVLNIGDLETFGRFLRLCAGRTGQMLSLSSLGADAGIAQPTARRWLSVLEASGIVVQLRPHHVNFAKRLVKTPKLYFLDTGVVCFLLGIRSAADLDGHPLHGAIFETFVVSELIKTFSNRGETPPVYFWRDQTGHEVDALVDLGKSAIPLEVKLSRTLYPDAFKGVERYLDLSAGENGVLVHGGDETPHHRGRTLVRPWWACS